ncbi:MAG: tRNA preQ1(34) S-adenosylmethionine ribosyltransferase-isomerase QueA [Patescibacteria group bacterium]
MTDFERLLAAYDYPLAKERIALSPATPRDSAKLLVYKKSTQEVFFDTFAHLDMYLPAHSLLVFNNTKVIPARLYATKKTGGVVEILCTAIDNTHNTCQALINKRLDPGEAVTVGGETITVSSVTGSEYALTATAPFIELVTVHGATPIPPYLKYTPLTEAELRVRYQALFAKEPGSVAAPTASLHFTVELLDKLAKAGVDSTELTLHVGLGTFAPLTQEAIAEGKLHEERYTISAQAASKIAEAKSANHPVIAVGTTALRTLESATKDGVVESGGGTTQLFIREGYHFTVVDGLITNFHVPQSSLLMLVAAFIGREKLFELYRVAIEKDFRFFSFGDGMLLLP